MPTHLDIDDVILNYDPAEPHARFLAAGLEGALATAEARLPSTIPWPTGAVPTAAPLNPVPAETDDLSRFAGYDAIVVTWTAAEATALATLFTPGHPTATWYQYRHGVADYIPLVTGPRAPFNDKAADMARYFHSLGLYFPCRIGKARVLLFKSGLHLAYDGPATPVRKLMSELASTVKPKIFVTTGTGGGIGDDVALGDVVVAGTVRFDCTTQFKAQPFHNAQYQPSALPAGALAAVTPALTQVNASAFRVHVRRQRSGPRETTRSSRPTCSPLMNRQTITNFRALDVPATWAMQWSATQCRRIPMSPGTRSATHPIRKSPIRPVISAKPLNRRARSIRSMVHSRRAQA
jgi:Phosphorylase superfamily